MFAALAAYSVARLPLPGSGVVLALVLAVSMFPQISIVTPLYQILISLHLIDTYPGLSGVYTSGWPSTWSARRAKALVPVLTGTSACVDAVFHTGPQASWALAAVGGCWAGVRSQRARRVLLAAAAA